MLDLLVGRTTGVGGAMTPSLPFLPFAFKDPVSSLTDLQPLQTKIFSEVSLLCTRVY